MLMLINFSNLALVTRLVDTHINCLCTKLLHVCVHFFCERVVNVWNSLPDDVSFDSFYRFPYSIMRINLLIFIFFIYFMRAINIVKVI